MVDLVENYRAMEPSNLDNQIYHLPAKYEFAISGSLCFVTGLTGIICNSLIMLIVHRNKKLHTPCFVMMACQAFFGLVMGTSFVTDGVHRIGYAADRLPAQMYERTCLVIYWTKTISHTPSALITCGIGLDRLLAISISKNAYGRAAGIVARLTIGLSVVMGFAHELIGVLTAPKSFDEVIWCLNYFTALNPTFATYACSIDLSFFLISVLIYGMIILKVKKSGAKFKVNSKGLVVPIGLAHTEQINEQEMFMKKQLALMPLIKSIMIAFIVVGVAPQVLSSIAPHIAHGEYQAEIVLYESILRSISTVCDFAALMIKCREFRKSLVDMFSWNAPISSG